MSTGEKVESSLSPFRVRESHKSSEISYPRNGLARWTCQASVFLHRTQTYRLKWGKLMVLALAALGFLGLRHIRFRRAFLYIYVTNIYM